MTVSFTLFLVIVFTASGCIGKNNVKVTLNNPKKTNKLVTLYGNINSGFCASLDNSTTQCWGANNFWGQMGVSSGRDSFRPKNIPELVDVKLLGRSANQQTCFIKKDDLVYCMGNNDSGQLGDGTTTSRSTPALVQGLSGIFLDVQVSNTFGCALKNDQTVWCWGTNTSGQLGDNTLVSHFTAAQVLNISTAMKIELMAASVCAFLADQTVWCWGANTSAQLGDSTVINKKVPVQASGVTGILNLSCGSNHCYALKNNGTIWTWGHNAYGQLANGLTANVSTPFSISGLANISKIYSSNNSGYAIDTSGVVYSWGSNISGQLGDGTHNNKLNVSAMSGVPLDLDYLVTSSNDVCAVTKNKSISCIGISTATIDGALPSFVQPTGNLSVVQVSSSFSGGSCLITTTGALKCWGRNDALTLNILGTDNLFRNPMDISGFSSGVLDVDQGNGHTCLLETDGTVWCWGSGTVGQLGNNTLVNSAVAVQATGLASVAKIDVGLNHTCALDSSNNLWCWGQNANGQIGNNTTTNQKTPVSILANVAKFAVGFKSSCAVKLDGTLWCWGANTYGQMGNGGTTNLLVPTQVASLGATVLDVAVEGDSVCATTSAQNVYCWGRNFFGQLGNGTFTNSLVPTQVSNLSGNITSIVASASGHYCVLMNEAGIINAYCWGRNSSNELGSTLAAGLYSPEPVLLNKISGTISSIKLGSNSTHIILSDNSLNTIGNRIFLGTGDTNYWFETFQYFVGWE